MSIGENLEVPGPAAIGEVSRPRDHPVQAARLDDTLLHILVGVGLSKRRLENVITNAFKLPNKVVTGYRGSGDMLLATERGEVEGVIGVSWSSVYQARRDWVETGKLNFLAQLALVPRGGHLKTVRVIGELADTLEEKRVLETIFSRQSVAFPFAAPPEVPAPRLEAIRTAFIATLADKQFVADAEASMTIAPVTGDDMAAMLKRIYPATPRTSSASRPSWLSPRRSRSA